MLRLVCAAVVWSVLNLSAMAQDKPLVMIVTDPLSARIACDCVSGYAQRDYDKLAAHLKRALHRNVDVVYAESFVVALKEKTQGQADIVIGKDSVIRYHAKALKLPNLEPMARLTDQKGLTTMKGLFVVKNDSPAASVLDLEGFRVFYGPKLAMRSGQRPKLPLKSWIYPPTIRPNPATLARSLPRSWWPCLKTPRLPQSSPAMLFPAGRLWNYQKGALRVVAKRMKSPSSHAL